MSGPPSIKEELFPQEERATTDDHLRELKNIFLQGPVSSSMIAQTDPKILEELFFLGGGVQDRVERANKAVRKTLLRHHGNVLGHLRILFQQCLPRHNGLYSCLQDTNEARRIMNYRKNMMNVTWAMCMGQQRRETPQA